MPAGDGKRFAVGGELEIANSVRGDDIRSGEIQRLVDRL
jgi:hypothetical protein